MGTEIPVFDIFIRIPFDMAVEQYGASNKQFFGGKEIYILQK